MSWVLFNFFFAHLFPFLLSGSLPAGRVQLMTVLPNSPCPNSLCPTRRVPSVQSIRAKQQTPG